MRQSRIIFEQWKQRHSLKIVLSGVVLGGVLVLCGGLIYFKKFDRIERVVVRKALSAFDKAMSFDDRLKVYYALPELNILVPEVSAHAISVLSTATQDTSRPLISVWAESVLAGLQHVESSWLMTAKAELRDRLLQEAQTSDAFTSLEARLSAVRQVLPPCLERNAALDALLVRALARSSANPRPEIEARLLEDCPPVNNPESCDPATRLLTAAVATFPGPPQQLMSRLLSAAAAADAQAEELQRPVQAADNSDPVHTDTCERALAALSRLFAELPSAVRSHVLQRALTTAIAVIHSTSSTHRSANPADSSAITATTTSTINTNSLTINTNNNNPNDDLNAEARTALELYQRVSVPSLILITTFVHASSSNEALDSTLLRPLREDARIPSEVLATVRQVFLALPADLQARVLLTALPRATHLSALMDNPSARRPNDTNAPELCATPGPLSAGLLESELRNTVSMLTNRLQLRALTHADAPPLSPDPDPDPS
jgi:hypothetical protein